MKTVQNSIQFNSFERQRLFRDVANAATTRSLPTDNRRLTTWNEFSIGKKISNSSVRLFLSRRSCQTSFFDQTVISYVFLHSRDQIPSGQNRRRSIAVSRCSDRSGYEGRSLSFRPPMNYKLQLNPYDLGQARSRCCRGAGEQTSLKASLIPQTLRACC